MTQEMDFGESLLLLNGIAASIYDIFSFFKKYPFDIPYLGAMDLMALAALSDNYYFTISMQNYIACGFISTACIYCSSSSDAAPFVLGQTFAISISASLINDFMNPSPVLFNDTVIAEVSTAH